MWRPVLHDPPLCRWKEVIDGTYSLVDIADMHEVMNVEAENNRRALAARKGK